MVKRKYVNVISEQREKNIWKTHSMQFNIFPLQRKFMNRINMSLFIRNHDNKNLTKDWLETTNLAPSPKTYLTNLC